MNSKFLFVILFCQVFVVEVITDRKLLTKNKTKKIHESLMNRENKVSIGASNNSGTVPEVTFEIPPKIPVDVDIITNTISVKRSESMKVEATTEISTKVSKKITTNTTKPMQKDPTISGIGFIYPGTLWCGTGNISSTPDDLGIYKETDACCRTHDNCFDFIKPLKSKHGLINIYPFDSSHCLCEEKFRHCLHTSTDGIAQNVGILYFNVARPKCYRKDYPKRCKKYRTFFGISYCAEYEPDTSKSRVYGWHDNKYYNDGYNLYGETISSLTSSSTSSSNSSQKSSSTTAVPATVRVP